MPTTGLWTVADRLGDGDALRLLLVKVKGSAAREFYDYVPATGALTPLLGIGESVEYTAAYAAQPGELLVVTNRFDDFRRLYRWKIGSDTTPASFREIATPPGRDVQSLDLDDARRRVYVGINDGGYARLLVLDARTHAPLDLPLPADAEQVRAGQSTPDGRYVTIGIETGTAPRTSYVWDWERRALTQWVVPSAPEVDLSRFVPRAPVGVHGPRRHADPDVRPLPEGLRAGRESERGPVPGRGPLPRRSRGPGAAGILALPAALRRRGLRAGRAEHPRQRRLRQGVARRRQRRRGAST